MVSFSDKLYLVSMYISKCALSCWLCIASSNPSSWVLPIGRELRRDWHLRKAAHKAAWKQMPPSYLICSPWAGGVTLSRCFQESGKDGWHFQVTRARRAMADLCFGLACRSGWEVKELTPLAEGPASGNPKQRAGWQQQCCCSMRLQHTQSEHMIQWGVNVHPHTSLEDSLGPRSQGWTGWAWCYSSSTAGMRSDRQHQQGSSTAVWGCEKGQQHTVHGGRGLRSGQHRWLAPSAAGGNKGRPTLEWVSLMEDNICWTWLAVAWVGGIQSIQAFISNNIQKEVEVWERTGLKKHTLPCVKSLESSSVNSWSGKTAGSGRGQLSDKGLASLHVPTLAEHCAFPGLEVVGGFGLHPDCFATSPRYGSRREISLV